MIRRTGFWVLCDIARGVGILSYYLGAMRARAKGPWSPEALEEDARRLAEFERTRMGVPWDDVKVWMESWDTANELPAPKPRKL